MLYTNQILAVAIREMKFGQLTGVAIGERGRGRQEVFLPIPKGIEKDIPEGLSKELTIGLSKSGRPRIDRKNDSELYLVLSSARGYTRRGCGVVRAPKTQTVEVIARGNGADGDAGRIGSWDAMIVKAHEGDVFRVTWGGYNYGYDPTFYVVHNGDVYAADQPEIEALYESLGKKIPFSLRFEESKLRVDLDEWQNI